MITANIALRFRGIPLEGIPAQEVIGEITDIFRAILRTEGSGLAPQGQIINGEVLVTCIAPFPGLPRLGFLEFLLDRLVSAMSREKVAVNGRLLGVLTMSGSEKDSKEYTADIQITPPSPGP